ncbi:MAG: hypothetical protein KGH94_03890 [Candidatus Micrarchaeota archaeon]|nr:hypothetical protein [Candidatus Micrarchaeota archaeon]
MGQGRGNGSMAFRRLEGKPPLKEGCLCLGMYSHSAESLSKNNALVYRFVVARPAKLFSEMAFSGHPNSERGRIPKRVCIKPIPSIWHGDMLYVSGFRTSERINLGYITYELDWLKRLAVTTDYQPKSGILLMGRKLGVGFPYFLEAVSTANPASLGIEYISTSQSPKQRRVDQLLRVDIEPAMATPIQGWLGAMGRGIRNRIEQVNNAKSLDPAPSSALLVHSGG